MNLYELTVQDKLLDELINNVETEEDYDAAGELMEEISHQIQSKGTGIIKALNTNEATIKAVDDEIKRLQAYNKVISNKQSRFKDYVLDCMVKLGAKNIETSLGVLSVAKTPGKLIIKDESKLHGKYVLIKQTEQIDKNMIKNDIKNGIEVEGCTIESGVTLRVK